MFGGVWLLMGLPPSPVWVSLFITSLQASHIFLWFFFLTSYQPSLALWQKGPNPVLKQHAWLGHGLAVASLLPSGDCSASRSCSGITCPSAVIAVGPQPQQHDFYSTAFLYRACSMKIPWDAFYIPVSWLSASLSIIIFFFFLEERGVVEDMV